MFCFLNAKVVKFAHNCYYHLIISRLPMFFIGYICIVLADIKCLFVFFLTKNITNHTLILFFLYLCI